MTADDWAARVAAVRDQVLSTTSITADVAELREQIASLTEAVDALILSELEGPGV